MIGGHAKTLMFTHVSPELDDIGETISTLKFAERVASIELGAARSNKETGDVLELKEEVKFPIFFLDKQFILWMAFLLAPKCNKSLLIISFIYLR